MHFSPFSSLFSALPIAALLPTLLASLSGATSPVLKSLEEQDILQSSAQWNTNISHYLFNELEELAKLTDIAYCIGQSGISEPFKCSSHCKQFPNFQLDVVLQSGILQGYSCGYIAVDHGSKPGANGRIIVAFRGTHSFADTITDLKFGMVKYNAPHGSEKYADVTSSAISELLEDSNQGRVLTYLTRLFRSRRTGQNFFKRHIECKDCGVHKGFMDSYERVRPLIMKNVTNLQEQYPNYELHIIGHSLGGAIATLAGLDFDAKGYNPIVTTYGQPRVGNEGLKRYINTVFGLYSQNARGKIVPASSVGRFRRVTHKNDPVPLLPPQIMGYRSHGGEIFISKPTVPPTLDDLKFCTGDDDLNCIAKKGLLNEWPEWKENEIEFRGEVEDMAQWENGELKKRENDEEAMIFDGPIKSHLSYFLTMGFCFKRFGTADANAIIS